MPDSIVFMLLLVAAASLLSLSGFFFWRGRQRPVVVASPSQPAPEPVAESKQDASTSAALSAMEGLRERLQRMLDQLPERRELTYRDFPAVDSAATIEAWLLQGKPHNAVAAANIARKSAPKDGAVRLHLARALFYADELEASARELVNSRLLGDHSPAQDYLEARIRMAAVELVCEAERERERGVEADQRLHRESAEVLSVLLNVMERDPEFGDAALHAGLLAIRLGLEPEGRRVLEHLEPLMDVSPERDLYHREIKQFN